MLYIKDKLALYPGRTVMEDVLSRESRPDKYSHTPYAGMRTIAERQFINQGVFALNDFIQYCNEGANEFNPSKVCPDDSLDTLTLEEALVYTPSEDNVKSKDFYWKLEEIDENWIARYVNQKAIGYKKEKGGRAVYMALTDSTPIVYDLETNAPKTLGELEESKQSQDLVDVIEAKEKLPFVLKQLHKGSIQKGASLMSFIIAAEQAHQRFQQGLSNYVTFTIEPKDFYTYGTTYEMQSNGMLGRRFEPKDNKCDKFREVVKWVSGDYPNDPYYKYYKELLNIAASLGISLVNEDAKDYQGEVIQQMECIYLQNNMEYLKNEVYLDSNILNVLTPDKLFKRGLNTSSVIDDTVERTLTKTQSARVRRANIQDFVQRFDYNDIKANECLQQVLNISKLTKTNSKCSIQNYIVDNGLLRDSSGQYLYLNAGDIVDSASNYGCYVSVNGWLILDRDTLDEISYYDLTDSKAHFNERIKKYVAELTHKAV